MVDFFTAQPIRAVRVLFSPMAYGWVGGWAGSRKKFFQAVCQKLEDVGISYLVWTLVGGVGLQHHGVALN